MASNKRHYFNRRNTFPAGSIVTTIYVVIVSKLPTSNEIDVYYTERQESYGAVTGMPIRGQMKRTNIARTIISATLAGMPETKNFPLVNRRLS